MTYPPSGQLVRLYKCETIYENFEGREGAYNRAGDRNFCVILSEKDRNSLESLGAKTKWNPSLEVWFVKVKHSDFGAVQWYGDLNIEVALTPYRVDLGDTIKSGVTLNLNRIL